MTQFTPFTHNFFESILSSIDSEDPVKANAWLDTLLDVIDLLPVEVLSKEVLAIAVNKAKDNQPVFSRLGSCQLIGKLGLKLEPQTILSELVPLTQSLSQDAEWTVRATMCAQLPFLLRGLAKSVEDEDCKAISKLVLSVLFELGDDEIEMVRLVVVESVSTGGQYLDKVPCPELTQTLMVPWIKRFSQQALKNEDKTLPMLAQHWARICRTMQPFLSDEEKEWFSNFYFALTSLGSTQQPAKDKPNMPDVVADTDNGQKLEIYAEVRHACAVNSAPMVSFVGTEAFVQRIGTLRTLAGDHYFVVRRAVAGNILELCRSLHPFGGALHSLFISLLIDPCIDVLRALVPQIGAVIESMSRLPTPDHNPFAASESIATETCQAVLRCEEHVMNGSLWRVQADMLSQLAAFPLCLPCHAIHDLLIPRLWHRIQTLRPLPCRVSAAQTLVLCVRSERRAKQRSTLCSDILNKLAAGDSCHLRMLFLRACPVLFDLLSRKFIRQHFFLPLVRMAGDKVANVRLRFTTLLPRLHVSLRGLDVDKEKQLIVELDSAVRWLVETEKDRDVKDELANFFRWVEEQERTMRSPEANQRQQDDEAADKRKESEEKLIDDQDQGVAVTESPVESHQPPPQQQQKESERTFFSSQVPDAQQSLSQDDEQPVALDPDDFYRDAGVRLASSPSASSEVHKASRSGGGTSRLRPPGHFVPSRIVPASSTTSATTLPHFGIARGVQQVQPQPSMATAVSVAPPMRRDRRALPAGSQLAAKSKSQENLTSPKPRAARPVSTCLAANEFIAASRQSPFNRTRLRASIGGTAPGASRSSAPPPIATVAPVREPPARWTASRTSPASKTVRLSDMKPALPLTRKAVPSDFQFTRRRMEPSKLAAEAAAGAAAAASSSAKVTLEETTRLLESLEISPSTRLRKPLATSKNAALSPGVADLASSKPLRVSSPEPTPIQRRNPWRRSLNFATASSSPPPPPPPRKNYATLPRSGTPAPSISGANNNNNNNSANNNNINNSSSNSGTNSKLPVPAFKRNSYLGSNI